MDWVERIKYLECYFRSRTGEVDTAYAVEKFYSSLHLVKTYCIPMLLYGCEVWYVRPVDMKSVDVAWNNSFRKIFNACWWEVWNLYSSAVRVCLTRYLFISVESSSGWKCSIVIIWLFVHLLIVVKTVSLAQAQLRNTESTVSSISFLRLNIWSKNIFGNILAAIICRCFTDFIVLFLCIAFFLVYCMCAFFVLVLFCCFGVINK